MSVSFTMKFYMSRWTSFIDDLLRDRAENQAALFFERARKKSTSFLAWARQTRRSNDLKKKSVLLVSIVQERMSRRALVHWDNTTISRHNARINFKVLKKRSDEVRVYKGRRVTRVGKCFESRTITIHSQIEPKPLRRS